MKELRIIIAGSREFNDLSKLINSMKDIIHQLSLENGSLGNIRIISGDAIGADKKGEEFAKLFGLDLSVFPADWEKNGRSAGYIRNVEMAKFAIEDNSYGVLVAFWNGKSKGTKHMIDTAHKYGLKVYVVTF